jgi:polar amino acid transport system substrate-binding protein
VGSSPISVAIFPWRARYAKVAQLVEHAPEKRGVARSIRALGRFLGPGADPPGLSRAGSTAAERKPRRMGVPLKLAALVTALVVGPLTLPARAPAAALTVGSDVSGAPFEYFQGGSKIALGFDIDLINAMAAKMGRQAAVTNHQFDDLLKAVQHGKFDIAMSAISDTSAREKLVNFLDYFVAGGGLMVQPGNPLHVYNLAGLCGYSVTIENGTSYQTDLQRQSDACKAIGLGAIKILTYNTDDDAFAAFLAGKAPVYVADYPVSVWRARTAGAGKNLQVVGRQFDVVPYGIAVAKSNNALLTQLQHALVAVVADGTYDRLLKKWGLSAGALSVAPVNAGKLFEQK